MSQSLCDIRELGAQVREPSPQPWQVAKPGVRGEVQNSQCGVRCDLGKAQVLPSKAAEVSSDRKGFRKLAGELERGNWALISSRL